MGYETKRAAIIAALSMNYEDPSYIEDDLAVDEHITPVGDDVPEHHTSSDCWCEPELIGNFEAKGGNKVWLHRETH